MARLYPDGPEVFPLCLGGNVFGWTIDEERSFEVLDAYHAAGGNFIDTADVYGRRGPDGAGSSERIIGRWMASRGNRDEIVIATKVGLSAEEPGLSRENVLRGAHASLQRLETDRIDLFYAHRVDPETSLQETLGAFGELLDGGLIRAAAASNYSAARLQDALAAAREDGGLARFMVLQPHYNLMERGEYEGELQRLCESEGISCVPYFSLARGFLTGKYRPGGQAVESERAPGVAESYMNDRGWAVLAALDAIAASREQPVAAVALAWLLARPGVVAPIASATSPAQLADLLRCAEFELEDREVAELDAASAAGRVQAGP